MASELKIPLGIPDVEVLNTTLTPDGKVVIEVESLVKCQMPPACLPPMVGRCLPVKGGRCLPPIVGWSLPPVAPGKR